MLNDTTPWGGVMKSLRPKQGLARKSADPNQCEVEEPTSSLRQCHIRDSSAPATDEATDEATVAPNTSRLRTEVIASINRREISIPEVFDQLIPARPYCANDFMFGTRILPKHSALKFKHVQLNRPCSIDWMCFDVDRPDAFQSWEDANLPAPTFISVNPNNGHAHLAYLLETPVLRFDSSRQGPLRWYADIERGFARRLGADPAFRGCILKNPLHPHWRSTWLAAKAYSLADLDCALDRSDKAPLRRPEQETGEGRNVAVFDTVRRKMYRDAFGLLSNGDGLFHRTHAYAKAVNQEFLIPLSPKDICQIAKSIARWIERKFSTEKFSGKQRQRAQRRWKDHQSVEKLKPWESIGCSRSTYYRNKKRARSKK